MATDDEPTKSNLLVELRLLIDGDLNWGDLIDFVETAQKYGSVDRGETVFHERSDDPQEKVSLVAWVDPGALIPLPE